MDNRMIMDLFDKIPMSLLIVDKQGNIQRCNEEICQLLGVKNLEELNYLHATLLREKAEYREALVQLEEDLHSIQESTFYHNDGTALQVLVQATKLSDVAGSEENILISVQSISKEEAESKERKSQHINFDKMLDTSPYATIIWDSNLDILACNDVSNHLLGTKELEELKENFFQMLPEYQPNGTLSEAFFRECLESSFYSGYTQFKWLFVNMQGEELATEVTIAKLADVRISKNPMIACFIRDLRESTVGADEKDLFDDYFASRISDKLLFQAVAELTDEWFIALDHKTSVAQIFGKGSEKFGLENQRIVFPDDLVSQGKIYEEDVTTLNVVASSMKDGLFIARDFRLITVEGGLKFCSIAYKTILNEQRDPVFTIGKVLDVGEKKRLEEKSQIDLLTKCYNKVTTETMIKDTLEQEENEEHVLFIVDIDNFKAINDNLGHFFGDKVLSEVASKLKQNFREEDLVGRLGGDEFIVFLKNTKDKKLIEERAIAISEAFKNSYSGEQGDYKISGSIGIACYPSAGESYEDLYASADKALYQSKLKGKDCYSIYSDSLFDGTMKDETTLNNAARIANSYFDTQIVARVLSMLMNGQTGQEKIENIFQTCKESMGFDKYHIEYIENKTSMQDEVIKRMNGDGVYYCSSVTKIEEPELLTTLIHSGMQAFVAIKVDCENGKELWFQIEVREREKHWTEREINTLLYVSKIISNIFVTNDL